MHKTTAQDKEFCARRRGIPAADHQKLHKPKSINELLSTGGKRLGALKARAAARTKALEHVRQALTPPLSETLVSAGFEQGRLTIGVAGAAWAARLRYATEMLRLRVGASMGIEIHSVKIKVVPPSVDRR